MEDLKFLTLQGLEQYNNKQGITKVTLSVDNTITVKDCVLSLYYKHEIYDILGLGLGVGDRQTARDRIYIVSSKPCLLLIQDQNNAEFDGKFLCVGKEPTFLLTKNSMSTDASYEVFSNYKLTFFFLGSYEEYTEEKLFTKTAYTNKGDAK